MAMQRVIVHSDINHCYAQIEEMRRPELQNIPMAVGGSVEKRNGIILAKNDKAKACGVTTGEALHTARAKCRDLVILKPDYEAYTYYTEKVKDIYRKYTDRVESFGLDEAWMDLSHSQLLFGDGVELAKKIQQEVWDTLGLKVSMGVSYNKVFAKMASDFFKDKGFSVVTEEDYQEIIWPLPVGDLLMVGSRIRSRLAYMGIHTIGDLARCDGPALLREFGKYGRLLWDYANGRDDSEVHLVGYTRPVKSVGNSKTLVKDVTTFTQLYEVFEVLSQSVAARLREQNLRGRVVSIWLRSTDLSGKSLQKRLVYPTNLAKEILECAIELVWKAHLEEISFRSIGLHVSELSEESGFEVMDLFSEPDARSKQKKLESVLQNIRERYGYQSCRYLGAKIDPDLVDFDPLSILHQIHPIGMLDGPLK